MDFKDSGLPHDPLIEKAFNKVHAIMSRDFGNPDHAMSQVVGRAIALCRGFRDDQPPVDLICAGFLAFMDEDTSEHDHIRDDYNLPIYQIVKKLDTLSKIDTGLSLALLNVPDDIKTIHIANAVFELRELNNLAECHKRMIEDDDVIMNYEHAISIGSNCQGVNAALDYAFRQEIERYNDLASGMTVPPPAMSGPKPTLH